MPSIDIYIDLLRQTAVRGITSAAPAPMPDFRVPQAYTVNFYFLRRNDLTTENYSYVRFATGVPKAKIRRQRPPEYAIFTLSFAGYTSAQIDSRLSNTAIEALIGAMPSIGKGNVQVTGNITDGWTVELIGSHAGYVQPIITGQMISPVTGEVVIQQIAAGGLGANSVQKIQLREAALATATGWTEIGVPATPGWSATLNTASVPVDAWEKGDLILETELAAQGVRTGADGITVLESTTRSGADGATVDISAVAGVTVLPSIDLSGKSWLVAQNGDTNYGRLWSDQDVGKGVSDGSVNITPGSKIVKVIVNSNYNAAQIDQPFLVIPPPVTAITVTMGAVPSKVYQSATAAFVAGDVGHPFSGTNIPAGTTIVEVFSSTAVLLSNYPTAGGTGLSWTVTAIPNNIFQSATGAFSISDVGARLEATQLPAGTYITGFIDTTHVTVSQRALAVAAAQSWTLRPAIGFAPPAVTSTQVGTLTLSETQQVSLTQAPIGGVIQFRDGADASLPTVAVSAPLTAENIRTSLVAAYPNFGDINVTEVVPNGSYLVSWGVKGKQKLLVVDESKAQYDTTVGRVPLGTWDAGQAHQEQMTRITDPTPPTPNLVKIIRYGQFLLGVNSGSYLGLVSWPKPMPISDGTGAFEMRVRFAVVIDSNQMQAPYASLPWAGKTYYFDRIENIEDRGAMRLFDWVGVTLPLNRIETLSQNRPTYIVPKSFLNGRIVDIQIASVTIATFVRAYYFYKYINTQRDMDLWTKPVDGPYGSVIHFVAIGGFSGVTAVWAGNGFNVGDATHAGSGTWGANFNQSWTRRRWRGKIWEEVVFYG